MKNNWQTKMLGEVCDVQSGLWTGKTPPFLKISVIRNTNFAKEGILDYTDIAHIQVEQKQFQKRKLAYGDIILEKSGGGPKQPVGRVVLFDKKAGDFSFSNFTSALRVKDKNLLDFNYLHKFLFYTYQAGVTETIQSHSTGIRNLDLNAYKEIDVPIPPLPEQRRIVAILDDVFERVATAKANAEKNLANAKEVFESYLEEVFSNPKWPIIQIDSVCASIIDCVNKTAPSVDEPTPFKMIRTTNVRNGEVNLSEVRYVSEKVFNQWTRRQLPQKGDVILTREAPLGEVGMLSSDDQVFLGQRLVLYRADPNKVNNYFLLHAFQTRAMKRQMGALASGSTVQHMRVPDSKKLKLPVPPLTEQNRVMANLSSIRSNSKQLEAVYRQKLSALEELKKSVLRSAFRGEL
jgi:type I restriction enzyme, S subunit